MSGKKYLHMAVFGYVPCFFALHVSAFFAATDTREGHL